MKGLFTALVDSANQEALPRDTKVLDRRRKGRIQLTYHEKCAPCQAFGAYRNLQKWQPQVPAPILKGRMSVAFWVSAACYVLLVSVLPAGIWFFGGVVRRAPLPFAMSVATSTAIVLACSVAAALSTVLSFSLEKALEQELVEARDASIELARETLAYEAILRHSPSAAAVVKAYKQQGHNKTAEGGTPLEGLSVTAEAVRTAAYKLVRRGRLCEEEATDHALEYFGSPLKIAPANQGPIQDSDAQNSTDAFFPKVAVPGAPAMPLSPQAGSTGDDGTSVTTGAPAMPLSSQASATGDDGTQQDSTLTAATVDPEDPLELASGFLKIMQEILPLDIPDDASSISAEETARRDLVHKLCAGGPSDCWLRWYKDYEADEPRSNTQAVANAPHGAGDGPVAKAKFINPLRFVAVALGAEASELLDGGLVQPRFLTGRSEEQKRSLFEALDFMAHVYGCTCFRRTKNFEPMGYPGLKFIMDVQEGRDLSKSLKPHLCMHRVSLAYGAKGVQVYKKDEPQLEGLEGLKPFYDRDNVDVGIASDGEEVGFGGDPGYLEGTKPLRLFHRFYGPGDRASQGFANCQYALFRDIGRAELLIAPVFFAKTFLTDAYSNKRPTCYEKGRPWYNVLYGAKLRKYAGLVLVVSVASLMLNVFSAGFLIDTSSTLGIGLVVLYLVVALFALAHAIGGLYSVCRLYGAPERAAQGIIDNFPLVKQYLCDKSEDQRAVNSVGDFLENCSKGVDFPVLEPIGGHAFWAG